MLGHFDIAGASGPPILEPLPKRGAVHALAVVQHKGGVGKTTIAVNLAAGLAAAGRRTMLIDLDPMASASRHLGLGERDEYSVADVIVGRAGLDPEASGCDVDAALDRIFQTNPLPSAAHPLPQSPGMFMVPASRALGPLERNLRDVVRIKQALMGLAGSVDVVIIDTPPRWGLLTISALAGAHCVVAPTELKPLSLMGMTRVMEGIAKIREKINPGLDPLPWVIPSRVRGTRLSDRCLMDLAETFRGRLLPSIRESTLVAESPGFHMPIMHYAPRSIGADDFNALTCATLERLMADPVPPGAVPGLPTA